MTGERMTSTDMIKEAFRAKVDESKPMLGQAEENQLDRLVARWIAKCGRPQIIVEDKEMQEIIACIQS